jgi:hypothetical protein
MAGEEFGAVEWGSTKTVNVHPAAQPSHSGQYRSNAARFEESLLEAEIFEINSRP